MHIKIECGEGDGGIRGVYRCRDVDFAQAILCENRLGVDLTAVVDSSASLAPAVYVHDPIILAARGDASFLDSLARTRQRLSHGAPFAYSRWGSCPGSASQRSPWAGRNACNAAYRRFNLYVYTGVRVLTLLKTFKNILRLLFFELYDRALLTLYLRSYFAYYNVSKIRS